MAGAIAPATGCARLRRSSVAGGGGGGVRRTRLGTRGGEQDRGYDIIGSRFVSSDAYMCSRGGVGVLSPPLLLFSFAMSLRILPARLSYFVVPLWRQMQARGASAHSMIEIMGRERKREKAKAVVRFVFSFFPRRNPAYAWLGLRRSSDENEPSGHALSRVPVDCSRSRTHAETCLPQGDPRGELRLR